jgi:hypothetical protein
LVSLWWSFCYLFRENILATFSPYVWMKFRNSDEAWKFCLAYGGQTGFEVTKRYSSKTEVDGKVTCCRFVCANEGHRINDRRDEWRKCPRAETRADCEVLMGLVKDRETDGFKVHDLNLKHNHDLNWPETLHLMAPQRKISDL